MAVLQKKTPSISIVIINYQTPELVLSLLEKLGTIAPHEIILVDHSPSDEIRDKLPSVSEIAYYYQGHNGGFAAGNNFGISKAKYDWILLLNSDTETSISDIEVLLNITIKKNYLVSAPQLVDKGHAVQNSAGIFDSFTKNVLNYIFVRPHFIDCSRVISETDVDLVTGAAMLIHKSVFRTAGYLDDKNFFMYFEDIDFCLQLYKKRVSILYVPQVKIVHFGGASSNENRTKNAAYSRSLYNFLKKNRGSIIAQINSAVKCLK